MNIRAKRAFGKTVKNIVKTVLMSAIFYVLFAGLVIVAEGLANIF